LGFDGLGDGVGVEVWSQLDGDESKILNSLNKRYLTLLARYFKRVQTHVSDFMTDRCFLPGALSTA